MKYLLSLFLIFPSLIYSQTKKLDFEFFLYGINHCYFSYPNREFRDNQIDIFFESLKKEEIVAEYLVKKINKDSIDYVQVKRIDRGSNFESERADNLSQYYMFSELIEKGLNENFSQHSSSKQIIKSKLDDKKANSFITGAYLRNGYKINDTIYKISIGVSSKPRHCYSILDKSNSTNVVFNMTSADNSESDILHNPISTVYFNPSNELKKYLDLINDVPSVVERFKAYFSGILLENVSSQKSKKKKKKAKEELLRFKASLKKQFDEQNLEDIEIVKKLLKQKQK